MHLRRWQCLLLRARARLPQPHLPAPARAPSWAPGLEHLRSITAPCASCRYAPDTGAFHVRFQAQMMRWPGRGAAAGRALPASGDSRATVKLVSQEVPGVEAGVRGVTCCGPGRGRGHRRGRDGRRCAGAWRGRGRCGGRCGRRCRCGWRRGSVSRGRPACGVIPREAAS